MRYQRPERRPAAHLTRPGRLHACGVGRKRSSTARSAQFLARDALHAAETHRISAGPASGTARGGAEIDAFALGAVRTLNLYLQFNEHHQRAALELRGAAAAFLASVSLFGQADFLVVDLVLLVSCLFVN